MRGFFAIEQPRGWKFVTAGACSDFSFFLCDPDRPLRQILYFGQAGPVYTNACQREIDRTCSARGGYPTPWLDMPAVDLLTPETFLVQLPLVLASEIGGAFMPGSPRFEQIRIVAAQAVESPISGGQCALVRAAFLQDGTVGEGLSCVTVAPLLPFSGAPGDSIASGFLITGMAASRSELGALVDDLTRCTANLNIDEDHASDCIPNRNRPTKGSSAPARRSARRPTSSCRGGRSEPKCTMCCRRSGATRSSARTGSTTRTRGPCISSSWASARLRGEP